MIRTHIARDGRKTYGVRIHRGGGDYEWVGTFDRLGPANVPGTARHAEAQALLRRQDRSRLTCGEWADRFLARYERERKDSSHDTARSALRRFAADFGRPAARRPGRHHADRGDRLGRAGAAVEGADRGDDDQRRGRRRARGAQPVPRPQPP